MNLEKLLAPRTSAMGASAIREILKVVGRPGMVSLAGGIPSPESFPMELLPDLFETVLSKYSERAFQYDLSEGFLPLREASRHYLKRFSVDAAPEEIRISSGSQGLLDAVGKLLIGQNDAVAVESPSYLGALQAFNAYGARYLEIESDDEGIVPESLNEILSSQRVKFVYLVPTFGNPTGKTLSLSRRRAVAEIITRHDALLVEDDPYAALRYSGETLPSIKSMAPENVLYATTLSKVFAPGLRVGIFVPPNPEMGRWLTLVKQGVDLHSSTLSQALSAEYISGGYLDAQLPRILGLYAPRRTAMLDAMDASFPDDWTWSRPEGGMFVWARGPENTDTLQLYEAAIERGVAFVPGRYFFANPVNSERCMRLNFSNGSATTLAAAVRTLAEIISGG